jgi:hypothetical protein
MAAPSKQGIISVRLQHPTEDRELEVRIQTGKYQEPDAVFTSVDVVNRILIPYYQATSPETVEELRKQVREQQLNDICLVLHQRPCSRLVPPINWSDPSPIIL